MARRTDGNYRSAALPWRDQKSLFRLANEPCRIPFEFVDPAIDPERRPGGTTISFLFCGRGRFFFWPVRPQVCLGAGKSVGGGILRFNLFSYQRRRAPIAGRVQ